MCYESLLLTLPKHFCNFQRLLKIEVYFCGLAVGDNVLLKNALQDHTPVETIFTEIFRSTSYYYFGEVRGGGAHATESCLAAFFRFRANLLRI